MLKLKTAVVFFLRKTESRVIPSFGCVSSSVLNHLRAPRNKAKTPCCPLLACSHREVAQRGEGRLGRRRGPARKPREGSWGAGDPGSFSSQARGTERHIWTQIWLPGGPTQEFGLFALSSLFFSFFFFSPCSPTRAPRGGFPPGTKAAQQPGLRLNIPETPESRMELTRFAGGGRRLTKKPPLSATGAAKRRAAGGCVWHRPLPAPEQQAAGLSLSPSSGAGGQLRRQATSLALPPARTSAGPGVELGEGSYHLGVVAAWLCNLASQRSVSHLYTQVQ